ncbi:MAG: chemotaxis response regulator protein-glutamate methylesterase [Synergistaceae bacterium]|jgi:two-component system chemotaxis response regulator CheB|nr:chemotaxis response regulator protein-glutamate methylesterase [Synergistaceae bacterium]
MSIPRRIRVLVVDDSAFMRKVIGDILSADQGIEIVGKARNGDEAMAKLKDLSPDVITLDMEMPGKNGLEVLRGIMKEKPTPVIMVSSLTKDGANVTMQALSAGAVDFVTKPSGTISLDMEKVGDELRQKIMAASKASMKNAYGSGDDRSHKGHASLAQTSQKREMQKRPELVLIASSTGGPNALQEVIPGLSSDFPLPILIVQHMPSGFTTSFANRMNELSMISVAEACDGMQIKKGMAIIAPGGYHLTVERTPVSLVCRLKETPPVRSVRPSADVLFSSVSEVVGGSVVVVVLTGMGKDGLDGTRLLRSMGAYVIAESKETCVIYGMPGAVSEAGLVDESLPVYSITEALERIAR